MQSTTWYQWIIEQPWIIELAAALVLLFILNVVLKRYINHLQQKAKHKEKDWRYHLDYVALTPARSLLWIILASVLLDLIIREFQVAGVFSYITSLRNAGIIACLAWILLRWKKVAYTSITSHPDRKGLGHLSLDPFTLEVAGKIFTVAVLFITILVIMQIFGLNILPLLTFGGIGAATLGFAGKDAIANFFGGLMIYLTRPFVVGDVIDLPHRKITGQIEEIGWYLTSVRDMQKQPIYIPNSVFSTEPLINISRITHRRIEESIGIGYQDVTKIPQILADIQSLFEHHTSVDHHQSIYVFLQSFGESSVKIEIKVYLLCTRYDDFMEARQELLLKIYSIIEKAGASMPYPTMHVIVKQET